ncbi:uncharacterized protein LOC6560661 [Drosophila grimshawi]|uniref:uncharacterized protein LOC6560661 n=1 Tax=Drosophila grimshawi TaxID=7222 RepID=UPI000C86E646|nr:uncharacterized protein LOC6560661 [Drosophila grimshawi]
MSLIVENEIEWLKTSILTEILRNGRLLDNYSESMANTFQVDNIQIKLIGPEEAYMLTICYRATIDFKYAGEQQQRKLIIKRTPKISRDLYDSLQFYYLFNNEVNFYTEILPVIQMQTKGQFTAPKYYHSEINANSAFIILGDFAMDGWSVTKDRVGLSLEHARIAVKYLGKFHGFGYVTKHTEAERFKQITSKLMEARFGGTVCTEWGLMQKASVKRAERATSKYQPQVDKDFIRKFQQLTFDFRHYGRQRVAPREPLATLCHGDYLRNNVAYMYDTDSSGNPLDIMMFDYQTMRLSSPMIDLSVFLAISLFADVRYKYFDSLFDDYCNALFESYKQYSSQSLPAFLNREDLLKEYIRFLPYSVSITGYFLYSLVDPPTITPGDMFNVKQTDEEIVKHAMEHGGEIVDREIAHQIKEMFELSLLHDVQIDEDIDSSDWMDSAFKLLTDKKTLFDLN